MLNYDSDDEDSNSLHSGDWEWDVDDIEEPIKSLFSSETFLSLDKMVEYDKIHFQFGITHHFDN
jgi:hypothetical protein